MFYSIVILLQCNSASEIADVNKSQNESELRFDYENQIPEDYNTNNNNSSM